MKNNGHKPDLPNFRYFAEEQMELNKHVKRPDGNGLCWRYKMAKGMLQIYDQIERKRKLHSKGTSCAGTVSNTQHTSSGTPSSSDESPSTTSGS